MFEKYGSLGAEEAYNFELYGSLGAADALNLERYGYPLDRRIR